MVGDTSDLSDTLLVINTGPGSAHAWHQSQAKCPSWRTQGPTGILTLLPRWVLHPESLCRPISKPSTFISHDQIATHLNESPDQKLRAVSTSLGRGREERRPPWIRIPPCTPQAFLSHSQNRPIDLPHSKISPPPTPKTTRERIKGDSNS